MPIGERIMGQIDPRELSKEQFEASPEILFHGAIENISFRQDFEYEKESANLPGGATVGMGLYTTDNLQDAERYSLIRKNNTGKPFVEKILPYQARMLDLRSSKDILINALVSPEFSRDWLNFIKKHIEESSSKNSDKKTSTEIMADQALIDHRSHLFEIFRKNPTLQFDLRELLGNNGESISHIFSRFMKKCGYDGLIYIEGGESTEARNTPSFVFYNLSKVGTYESWNKKQK